MELIGNFGIGQPLGQQVEHLQFALAQVLAQRCFLVVGAEVKTGDPPARETAMADRSGTRGANIALNTNLLNAIIDFLEAKIQLQEMCSSAFSGQDQ